MLYCILIEMKYSSKTLFCLTGTKFSFSPCLTSAPQSQTKFQNIYWNRKRPSSLQHSTIFALCSSSEPMKLLEGRRSTEQGEAPVVCAQLEPQCSGQHVPHPQMLCFWHLPPVGSPDLWSLPRLEESYLCLLRNRISPKDFWLKGNGSQSCKLSASNLNFTASVREFVVRG